MDYKKKEHTGGDGISEIVSANASVNSIPSLAEVCWNRMQDRAIMINKLAVMVRRKPKRRAPRIDGFST